MAASGELASALVVGGTVRRHMAASLDVATRPDADVYEVLTAGGAELVLDVRGVWVTVTLTSATPGGAAGLLGGDGYGLREVWLDLLSGAAVSLRPVDGVDIDIPVLPDPTQPAVLSALRRGMPLPGTTLALRSRLRYAPDSDTLRDLARWGLYRPLTSTLIQS